MTTGRPRALWALVWLAFTATHWGCDKPHTDTQGLLSRDAFRCLSVSESMRTIGPARLERKRVQLARIERLLKLDLDRLDSAKLLAERAVLIQEVEDSRFLYDCAETYYAPGSTGLRPSFGDGPSGYDAMGVGVAFATSLKKIPAKQRPRGFNERAALHTAQAALQQGDLGAASSLADEQLRALPTGLYSDTLSLVWADAQLRLGENEEAEKRYDKVGNLPIGADAHYARYRHAQVLRQRGDSTGAEKLMASVLRWAERGDRDALARWIRGKQPTPPLATPRHSGITPQ